MKQNLFKFWLTMLCLIVGVGSAWSEETELYREKFTSTTAKAAAATESKVTASQNMFYDKTATVWSHYARCANISKQQTSKHTADYCKDNTTTSIQSTASNSTEYTILEVTGIDISGATDLKLNYAFGFSGGKNYKAFAKIDDGNYVQIKTATSGGQWQYVTGESITGTGNQLSLKFTYTGNKSGNIFYLDEILVTGTKSDAGDTTPPSAPTFSQAAGTVEKGTQITFSSETAGCTFRYTTDGTDPTATTGTAGSTYTVNSDVNLKVVAVKGGLASETVSSASYTVAKHNATFYINSTPNATSYAKGETINIPSTPAEINGKKFMGWSESEISGTTETKPTIVTPAATMGTSDIKYYAVYANAEVGNTYTQITAANALEAGARYLIVGNSSSTYKALPVDQAETLTTVTPSSSKITNPAEELIWTLEGQSDQWKIKSVSNGKYLQISGGNLTFEASTNLTFKASVSSSKFTFTSSASSGSKVLSYYAGGSTFNAYTSANNVYLYKASVEYSSYCTTIGAPKTLHHITVSGAKTLYKVGDTFSTEGMTVTAYYDEGGTDSEVINTGYTVSKTGALTADDNTITISYTKGEVTKTAEVNINVVTLDHIAVTTAPTNTNYTECSNFDRTGMVVTAYWGTAAPNVIEEQIEDYTVTGGDNLQVGTSSVTISYQGKSITQTITVTALPTWTVHFSINGAVDNANDKTCKQGQSITEFPTVTTATGVTFMGWAKVALEETETAPTSYVAAADATSYTPTADGEILYAVYKRTEEAEHEGMILSITSGESKIYVGTKNSDYLYAKTKKVDAEILFFEEGTFKYYDANGTKQTAISGTYTENAVTEGDNAGTVTYSYTSGSDTYYLGYNYNNGSTPRFKAYKNSLSTYNGYFTKEVGVKVIPTDYYTTTVTLPVLQSIEITTVPTKTEYFEGDDFDKTGMVVVAHYNTKDKTISSYTVSPRENLTAGTDKVTVSYTDGGVTKTADQTISVAGITLQSISVTTQPTTAIYKPGDSFDVTGMVVAATYNDTRKNKDNVAYKTGDVTDGYTISPETFTEKGEQDVTISYTDGTRGTQTTTVRVQVNAALQSIAVTTAPSKTTYTRDEQLDKTGMVVTATYEGGATADVTATATTDFDDVAFTTVGQQTVTVTYTELGVTKTTTFDVTINDYPTYTVTFYVNGVPTEVPETEGKAGVVPVSAPAIGDYTFAGWSTTNVTEETTTKPAFVTLTSGKYFPSASIPLYAVYTKDKDVEQAGFYLSNGDGKYAGAENFSKSGGDYKGGFSVASSTTNATTFYFEGLKLFWINGSNKYYIQGSSSADIFRVTSSSDATSWIVSNVDDGKKTFQVSADGRYLGFNGTTKFANYGSSMTGFIYELTLVNSTNTYITPTPHYTSSPVATTTPTASFAEATKTVVADQTVTQTVTTNSTGAVTYRSSDETIARVDRTTGVVTGLKYGTATITADIAEVPGKFYANSATYTVNVNRITTTIKFDDFDDREATTTVYADNNYTFKASTNAPEDDVDAPVIVYSLANNTYATINSETGEISFKAATADNRSVTAYAKVPNTNTRYTSCNSSSTYAKLTITVKDNRRTQTIAFPEGADRNFVKGDEVKKFTVAATGASTSVTYTSSNTDVAEVDENTGEVTVHTTAGGTATITATAEGDKVWNEELGIYNTYNLSTATYTINVDNMARPVISVAGGNYDAAQTVTISGDAYIYFYTLDGTNPTYDVETMDYHGTEYSDPITINKNCTLKVIAISADMDEVSAMAEATYTFNFPTAATTAWENEAERHLVGENYVLTAPEGATISYQINEEEKVVTEEQVVNINFENYGKYNLVVDVVKNGLTTTTAVDNLAVYGFADVPFTYDGNSSEMPMCFYGNTGDYSESPKIQFKNNGATQLTLMVNDGAAQLSFDYKFNGTWADGNSFQVEMSVDGTEWETLKTYNSQLTSGELQSDVFTIPSLEMVNYHYFRWTYTKQSGNWALGNIKVLKAAPEMTISGESIHQEAYLGTQVVEVSAADAAMFYYTTDGREPSSDAYDGMVEAIDFKGLIEVKESCTLKVVAANVSDEVGAVSSAVITIEQPSVATDQTLFFERPAKHFTADETMLISNYHGQPVLGANTAVTYSVVNEGDIVAAVDAETGRVNITSGAANGTATITATAAASGYWNEASATYTITVGNLPAPTLLIAGEDFQEDKFYAKEQFADLRTQGGYIAYTTTYNDLNPEPALNGDIPGTLSDRVWLPSQFCEATGTYIDGVFEYDNPNDIDVHQITIRAVAAMPYIREEGGVKHEEFRAVSDEAIFVINIFNGELTLDEANTTIDAVYEGYESVVVSRTLKAGYWNTFCVPFDMTAEDIRVNLGSEAVVKELDTERLDVTDNGDGVSFNMHFAAAEQIKAGVPYMVNVPAAVSEIRVTNKVVDTRTEPCATAENANGSLTFHGNYAKMLAPLGSFIISNNLFYLVDSEVNVKGFRGYITTETSGGSQARALSFNFDDLVTGISLNDNDDDNDNAYDLSGRMISKLQRGVNIVNGRKVIK